MSNYSQVDSGDCCSSLAAKYGFADYKAFYDKQPPTFKRHHPNPNQLTPKSLYLVPPTQQKQTAAGTARVHTFQLSASQVELKIEVRDANGQSFPVDSCLLTLDDKLNGGVSVVPNDKATTEVITHKNIALNILTGSLKIRRTPPAYRHPEPIGPPVYTEDAKLPYPPPIEPGAFQDVEDETYLGKFAEEVEWTLEIGALPPHTEEKGVSARLENLGFSLDKGLSAAVEAFQVWLYAKQQISKEITGQWEDIQNAIQQAHDML